MSQHQLRVPEPEGLGRKRTSSEDNLYLAVLRASEGKKGSRAPLGHLCQAGRAPVGGRPTSCGRKPWHGVGGLVLEMGVGGQPSPPNTEWANRSPQG